jgi:hypothetical protein
MKVKRTKRFSAIYALTAVSSKIKSGEFAASEKTKVDGYKVWFTVGPSLVTWIRWKRNLCSTFSLEAGHIL